MLIDRNVAAVGTAKFGTGPSAQLRDHAVVSDEDLAARVESMFEGDFTKARLVGPGEYEGNPFRFRFRVRLAAWTASIH